MQISYPALSSSWEVTELRAGKPRFCARQVKVLCTSLPPSPIWTADLLGKGPSLIVCTLPGVISVTRLCNVILHYVALYALNAQC